MDLDHLVAIDVHAHVEQDLHGQVRPPVTTEDAVRAVRPGA
ncbi:hypothetical protein ACI782_12600 [Geodermatophilus sp. SYSU D00703]